MSGPEDARSGATLSLLSEVIGGLGRLVQGELRLAQAEATEGLKAAGNGLAKLVLAAILGLVGLNVLASAAVAALVSAGLGPAWASLVVGLVVCLLALVLAIAGRAALQLRGIWPDRTLRGIWRDGQALRRGLGASVNEGGLRDVQDA